MVRGKADGPESMSDPAVSSNQFRADSGQLRHEMSSATNHNPGAALHAGISVSRVTGMKVRDVSDRVF